MAGLIREGEKIVSAQGDDYPSFRCAFDERFDKVVDRRRSRNAELRQMLVEPSVTSKRIRATLEASVFANSSQ